MRTVSIRFYLFISFLLPSQYIFAQAQTTTGSNDLFITLLLLVVVLIVFSVLVVVSGNLLKIEAKKAGIDAEKANLSLMPRLNEILSPSKPDYVGKSHITHLRRGFDILLEGAAPPKIDPTVRINTFAIQPPNFRGIAPIPKVVVQTGDNVLAGDEIFYDKKNPDIKYVAPVSGEVIAINRGDRRAITEVVILADKEQQYRQLPPFDLQNSNREQLVAYLIDAGAWSLFRRRPYDIVPDKNEVPRDIFISTFDTAPLAPDLNFVVEGQGDAFQKGLDVLAKLTTGKVHLGLSANADTPPSEIFSQATGVEKYWFSGKHPAGNVGIQIHHIAPISPNCAVWTLGVQEVITLGRLFTEGRWNTQRLIALTGAELKKPVYVQTFAGANIGELLHDNLTNDHVRFISGDVLSGQKKSPANFLNFYDDQLTVVLEGDYYEMFGWLFPSHPAPTISKSFPGAALFPGIRYRADTNTHGEKRAFVVSGQYEKVLPMDVYPQHLMKAILTNDYEKMEGLGIHELIEEDIALCEFACTSKQPLQQILRTGLEMMQEQG